MSNTATGPRTDAGKERSSLNATLHGLCSERPIVVGEDPAEWDTFQAEIVSAYRPATFTERELAERIALQMWRQRRAGRYETAADTEDKLDRVIRYEAHVTRQLKEARKMLLEMQAERQATEAATRRTVPTPRPTPPRVEEAADSSFRNFEETSATPVLSTSSFRNSEDAAKAGAAGNGSPKGLKGSRLAPGFVGTSFAPYFAAGGIGGAPSAASPGKTP